MWKLIDGQRLSHRGWEDEYVVYNDISGDTHLFGPDAMQLLLRLQAAPADEDVLAQALDVEAGDRDALVLALEQLAGLNLIERA
ncbi:HPr-rel-A system PqqD family peptide chaperone [Massilia sp. KIM]|uniref:HPr-rel-A system PqqD family peptide chaperone n=1 Tax=Massilia sp. KIM TaxID=1955422 RepID=UPI00098F65EC|nr:HPr-rel-A system PqqD family peptide chaperone [Massilia sp. KIM]